MAAQAASPVFPIEFTYVCINSPSIFDCGEILIDPYAARITRLQYDNPNGTAKTFQLSVERPHPAGRTGTRPR
jgi:hypothetical protein